MKLSIVATLYHSAMYIPEFLQRISNAAQQLVGDDYELILVNDASPDNSLDIAVQYSHTNPHLKVIDLSRNFGHHKAMMTGLAHSHGTYVFLLDSDLEEEPEWLLTFNQLLHTNNVDVVFGVQDERRGQLFEKITGKIFYRLFRLLTGVAQPDNIVTARLMTRRYVDALLQHREREINIGGLWIITGFAQMPTTVHKHSSSPTTYNIARKFEHLINAITSFSHLPLTIVFYIGIFILIFTFFYIFVVAYRYLFISQPPSGYTSLVISIWLLAGFIIFAIGLLGIYVAKIFSEVKQRPYTIVRDIYSSHMREDGNNE